ncbi:hypothetical protein ACFX14_036130 [Malus domestica]
MDAASCSVLRAQPFSSAVFPPSNNPTPPPASSPSPRTTPTWSLHFRPLSQETQLFPDNACTSTGSPFSAGYPALKTRTRLRNSLFSSKSTGFLWMLTGRGTAKPSMQLLRSLDLTVQVGQSLFTWIS